MTKEQAYKCLHEHGLNDEQIVEIEKALKHKEYIRFLPCKCGYNRREMWFGFDTKTGEHHVELVCKKCGYKVSGKNEADAKREWNESVGEKV